MSTGNHAPSGADERKILHVFDHSFPIGDGYSNRSGEIIRFTRGLGWRTVHSTSAKQGPTTLEKETVNGIEFLRTRSLRAFWASWPALNQWSVVVGLRRRLEEILIAERPVLLHIHSPCLNALAALPLARKYAVPIIYEMRSLWEDGAVDSGSCNEGDLRYRTSRWLETYVCHRVDQVVTICEGLKGDLLGRGLPEARITVVPNSVDISRFGSTEERDQRLAIELGLTAGKTFGFIGTFFPFEGLEVLMRAIPKISAAEPQARFLIVGDGPDAHRIREMAQRLSLSQSVIFTGRIAHDQVKRYYSLIDVLIYPRVSKRITELVTPLKPLEAMAQGKMVVASDVGGHREMIFPGENGLLFEAGNPDSLFAVCRDLLSRQDTWPGLQANGRNYVRTHRSWENNAMIYDHLYRHALEGPRVKSIKP